MDTLVLTSWRIFNVRVIGRVGEVLRYCGVFVTHWHAFFVLQIYGSITAHVEDSLYIVLF